MNYWIGNSGDWDDIAHWSIESGGPSGAPIPTPDDNVYFDSNSFTLPDQEVLILSAGCLSMDWSGVTNNPTLKFDNETISKLNVYGDITFSPNMSISYPPLDKINVTMYDLLNLEDYLPTVSGVIQIENDCHLTSCGLQLPVIFSGSFDNVDIYTFFLEDNLSSEGLIITKSFDSQEHNINSQFIMIEPISEFNGCLIDIENSTINVSIMGIKEWVEPVYTYFNPDSTFLADIVLTPIDLTGNTEFPENIISVFANVTDRTCLINSITITSPLTYFIAPKVSSYIDYTINVNHFYSDGEIGNNNLILGYDDFMVITNENGIPWWIKCTSGTIDVTNTTIQNSYATGGSTFNAYTSNGCIDNGDNAGWYFNPPNTLYLEDDLNCSDISVGESLDTQSHTISSTGFTIAPVRSDVTIDIEDSDIYCLLSIVNDPNNYITSGSNFDADVIIKEI